MKNKTLYAGLTVTFVIAVICIVLGINAVSPEHIFHDDREIFHIGIDMFGACICVPLFYGCMSNKESDARRFIDMVLITSMSFCCNEWMHLISDTPEYRKYYFGCCILSKWLNLGLIYTFYLYVRKTLAFKGLLAKTADRLALILGILSIIVVTANIFTPVSFTVDAGGMYSPTGMSFLEDIYIDVMSIITTLLIINTHTGLRQKLAAMSFIFIPIIQFVLTGKAFAYATQYASVLLSLILAFAYATQYASVLLSLILMYCILFSEKSEELLESQLKINNMQSHTISELANLIENRDLDTGEHVARTSSFIRRLAEAARQDGVYTDTIDNRYIYLLYEMSPLHDVGKIVVPDSILRKPGKLTKEEFEEMKGHSAAGDKIVGDILNGIADEEEVVFAREIARYHHEWWNGNGYPDKLSGTDIPLNARMMAIVDVYDALTSKRCYKDAMPAEKACSIIEEEAGTHFDPLLVKVFLKHKDEFSE